LGRDISEVENLMFASKNRKRKSTSGEKSSTMRMKLVIINQKGNLFLFFKNTKQDAISFMDFFLFIFTFNFERNYTC
jgi:hypothetical protein